MSWHVENICTEIYSWFKQSPARKEDLANLIDEFNDMMEKTLLYFVLTRWVLLGKVISRVLSESIEHRSPRASVYYVLFFSSIVGGSE